MCFTSFCQLIKLRFRANLVLEPHLITKQFNTMARQNGVIKYVGTLGDIRHFKIKGQHGYFAGMKGGPTKEQVLTAPEFERTRENMNEFGGSAKAGKSVRNGFAQLMSKMSDTQLTGRLTGIMKKINLEDQSEARGYRAILISTERNYINGLDFNKNISLNSVLSAPYSFTHPVTRDSADLVIPAFNPADLIMAPPGATHFRLINALAIVSDFAFNDTTGTYEPIQPSLNEISNVEFSDYLELREEIPATTLSNELTVPEALTSDVTVLQAVGIEFYQKVGIKYYQFSSGNCLKIVEAF